MRAFAVLVLGVLLAGCAAPLQGAAVLDEPPALATSRAWSMPTSPALYEMLPAIKQFVPVADGTELALGLFLPDIAGCDWEALELPAECKLPAVMDAGPYYAGRVDEDKYRPPTIEWLVPRGYAVLQMSLRGTGESGGCLEFKNPQDVADIHDIIEWISTSAWSNGNIGMIGRSYDGTSAWAGAAGGHPALKAILPISGAVDGPGLYYKNGTTETRGPINGATYFPDYATDAVGPADWPQRLCQGALFDVHRESAYSALTGDASSAYWQARDLRPLILENYRGAAFVVHGLHDWNVNPSQAVPFLNDMQDAGIEVKAWLGVWGHAYPDRVDEHRNVRWDWADHTVRFFDRHLKGADVDTGPAIEVEDSLFVWRAEASWPPRDATPTLVGFDVQGNAIVVAGAPATVTSEPFAQAIRIAGLPTLHVPATSTTAAPVHVFAELHDVYPDGRSVRIGWAAINLHHADGGNDAPTPTVPGQSVLAKVQFEPVDALVAQGHRLRLVLHLDGVEDVMASPHPGPVALDVGSAELTLPVVQRDTVLTTYAPPRHG